VDVLPVNFIVDDEDVVFRTSEGSEFAVVRHGQQLSFEADDVEPALHVGCSVLISGPTRIVQEVDEIGRLESTATRSLGVLVQAVLCAHRGRTGEWSTNPTPPKQSHH
jgi:hypothetical protein